MNDFIRISMLKLNTLFILVFMMFSCEKKEMESASADTAAAPEMESEKSKKSDDDKDVKTWQRSEVAPNTPKLFVGDKEELALKGTQMTVQVDGFRARILMDCYYYNDRNFTMEGTFKLKLPNDASPYYFAFGESVILDKDNDDEKGWKLPFLNYKNDVNLNPETIKKDRDETWQDVKEARIVPKEKAAFAYRQTVRANVDPAIMEWAGADIFNCRVFPLQANKLHRIVIGYDVNLLETDLGKILNLSVPNTGSKFKLEMDLAADNGYVPQLEPSLDTERDGKRIRVHAENPYADEIKIKYKVKDAVLLTEQDENKQSYFASSFKIDLPTDITEKLSENAVLILDVSLSSNPDKFNVWLKMAEAILKNNRNDIKKFNVLFFNVEQFWWKENYVNNTTESVQAFLDYANNLSLEGATDPSTAFDRVTSFLNQSNSNANLFLLSDGAVTWGEDDIYIISDKIKKGNSVYAFKSGMEGTDLRILEQLTQTTGGKLFSVLNEDEINNASKAYKNASWKIDGIQMNDASDILIAGRPQYLFSGQNVILAGRGAPEKNSKVTLNLSRGKIKKTIEIKFNHTFKSSLTSRVYGQIATAQLETFSYLTEKYSKAFASYFRVPGQTCSFLMLDNEMDYQRFNINRDEDLFVVKTVVVSKTIEETLKNMSALLSPKENFKKWVSNLSSMPGMEMTLPASLDILLDQTPEASFKIPMPILNCKLRAKNDIRKSTLKELDQSELDYDIITTEAMNRKERYGADDGLKLLSSMVEKNPGDGVLIRDVGFSAMEWGLDAHAFYLFRKIIKTRPYEPQTYHAIAQVLAKMKNTDLAVLYYELCLAGKWDERFGDFNTIVKMDYLNLLNQIEKGKAKVSFSDYVKSRRENLQNELGNSKSNLAIVIMWNTDNTDIDLHVTEPSGEECFYSNPHTADGGNLTRDVTQGYGPEMYTADKMKWGDYKVRAHYYSKDRNRSSVRTKIYATVYKNWGSKNEKIEKMTVTLDDDKEYQDIITLNSGLFE